MTDDNSESTRFHPVQTKINRRAGQARVCVTMRAYEVYRHVFGSQEAMITGNCRGGFDTCELVAFLYARSFPKEEWRARFDEALRGLNV